MNFEGNQILKFIVPILICSLFSKQFPVNAKVTDEAKDLMSNLICDQSTRFKSLDQFKNHAWFTGQYLFTDRNISADTSFFCLSFD